MKNKEYLCPVCNKKCKYRGSRIFYCSKCKESYTVQRDFEPRFNNIPSGVMFNDGAGSKR